MRILVVLLILAVAAGGGLGFAFSGLVDVAATSPHWAVTEWILSTAMERSVRRRANDIEPPALLDEDARVRAGALAYDDMCASCHGAPGAEPGVVGKGLNPAPPELATELEEWSPAELFWITKHGVRMTGMPAFGPTHADEELWEIVALLRQLPRMSPARYRVLAGSNAEGDAGHSHEHESRHDQGHSH